MERSFESVLEARTRALARRVQTDEADATSAVVLSVAAERYSVDVRHVEGVVVVHGLAVVPGLPNVWAGLVNVRGIIRPVLDLASYLDLPDRDTAPQRRYLVFVSHAGITVGLLSHAAPELRRIQTDSVRAAAASDGRNAVSGITSDFLSILDVEKLLTDPRVVERAN